MGWVKHDLNNRKNDLGNLLSFVKLPLLSPSVSPGVNSFTYI